MIRRLALSLIRSRLHGQDMEIYLLRDELARTKARLDETNDLVRFYRALFKEPTP